MQLICVLGNVRAVGPGGGIVEVPSASQRRLLGLLALHTQQRLRTEWLADVLEMSPGALRRSVSRLRTVLGPDTLVSVTLIGWFGDVASSSTFRCPESEDKRGLRRFVCPRNPATSHRGGTGTLFEPL